ncbi:MAG: hypothetical protein IGS49_29035 [Chlorogloeopsis fritschii C42_A2020_084]|nr:hypothetical protein [Chlorogloeopsis fritschii C42_A2020_084]
MSPQTSTKNQTSPDRVSRLGEADRNRGRYPKKAMAKGETRCSKFFELEIVLGILYNPYSDCCSGINGIFA